MSDERQGWTQARGVLDAQGWWRNSSLDTPAIGADDVEPLTADPPRYAGLTSAQDMARRQAAADRAAAAATRRSSLAGLTARVAFQDAREALLGIPRDLFAGDGDLGAVLTRNDRLRGLGVLALAACLLWSLF